MAEIVVTREGHGPELLLVHGGASPRATWRALGPLAAHWTLVLVHRRGYPPSPPGRHDFELDALDLAPLLESRPHVLAHSYGVLGTLIADTNNPNDVRSLTLIEPPLYHLVPGDPEVESMQRMGDAVLTHGLRADPSTLREFLALAGAPDVPDDPPPPDGPLPPDGSPLPDGSLPPKLAYSVRRAHGARLPGEARPPLQRLRDAGIPSLVASGGHSVAIERICDALASELRAERVVIAGAGHFVQSAPGFAEILTRHLTRCRVDS
jgi:pimeloyl-ACP methyl ester carboxylesterase